MASNRHYDILVVGAGPAGVAAALAASQAGGRVGLVDENPAPGGQIWRGESTPSQARRGPSGIWLDELARSPVELIPGTRVIARQTLRELLAESPDGPMTLSFERLVLATGCRERLLPFPGWTLPNVMGAGGLQALVKSGLPIEGKSVVVAGSGPLLLAVADNLQRKGALVRLIAEQASRTRILHFALGLLGAPAKLSQAFQLKLRLRAVPYRPGCWPVAALGDGRLAAVTLTNGTRRWDVRCDYLACGFGLVPNTELPLLLGCKTGPDGVLVDEVQLSSVDGIYCAGEATGIGGVDKSLVEGTIAGFAASDNSLVAQGLFPRRDRARAFAARLERTFALRDELRSLPEPGTIVCRCEDVTFSQLVAYESWRSAKLQTRCGMGPCQGRTCGPAIAFLRQCDPESVRPPAFPARLGSLSGTGQDPS